MYCVATLIGDVMGYRDTGRRAGFLTLVLGIAVATLMGAYPAAAAEPALGSSAIAAAPSIDATDSARAKKPKPPTRVSLAVDKRTLTWTHPLADQSENVTFKVLAKRTPKGKARVLTVSEPVLNGRQISWELPWVAKGPVKVAIRQRTGGSGAAEWVSSAWSKKAKIAWGTNATVTRAASSAGRSFVTITGDSQRARVVFSNTLPADTNAPELTARLRLGQAEAGVDGEYQYVTITAITGKRQGEPVTAVVSRSAIQEMTVESLAPDAVEVSWVLLGDARIDSIRRTVGREPASNGQDGEPITFEGAALVDNAVTPGQTYTYTLFGVSPFGDLDPTSIQVRIPDNAATPDGLAESWVLTPNTETIEPSEYTVVAADSTRSTLSSAQLPQAEFIPSKVAGSTALIQMNIPAAAGRNRVGAILILQRSKQLPGGLVGEVVQQNGAEVWLRQAPAFAGVEQLQASLKTDPTSLMRAAIEESVIDNVGPSAFGWSCGVGGQSPALPVSISVGNLTMDGRADIAPPSPYFWAKATVDVTVEGAALKGSLAADCSVSFNIPDIPFSIGPVPMLAKFDASATAGVNMDVSAGAWSRTWRIGFQVGMGDGAPATAVINQEISRVAPTQFSGEGSANFAITGSLLTGPGVGNDFVGAVAGLTASMGPGVSLTIEPGQRGGRPFDSCLKLGADFSVEAGFAAKAWLAFWNWESKATVGTSQSLISTPDGTISLLCWQDQTDRGPYVTKWDTNLLWPQSLTVSLPLTDWGEHDFTVSWGDGTSGRVTSAYDPDATHTYARHGEYTVTITGQLQGWNCRYPYPQRSEYSSTVCTGLVDIVRWGNFNPGDSVTVRFDGGGDWVWDEVHGAFGGSEQFPTGLGRISAQDAPRLSGVRDLRGMFHQATEFDGDLSGWDVSSIELMDGMFVAARSFSGDLSGWCVSNIRVEPSQFAEGAGPLTPPQWGTCPR